LVGKEIGLETRLGDRFTIPKRNVQKKWRELRTPRGPTACSFTQGEHRRRRNKYRKTGVSGQNFGRGEARKRTERRKVGRSRC